MTSMTQSDVLLVTIEAHGHIRPFMALGELLHRFSNGTIRSHLLYLNLRDDKVPKSEFPHVEVYAVDAPEEARNLGDMMEQFKWMIAHGSDMIEPSCEYANQLRPVAVIYESFLEWGHNLGDLLGVKSFAFCTFALHMYYLMGKIGWHSETPASEDQRTIRGLGTLSTQCLPYSDGSIWKGMLDPGLSRSIITNDSPCQPGFKILQEIVERDLLVSTPKFDKGVVHTLGYLNDFLSSKESTEKPDGTIEWLNTQPDRSVIFIVLGSWVQLDVCDVIELAEGLRMLNAPFLWALRKRSGDSKGSNGPPDVGGGDKPDSERTRVPSTPTDEYGLPVGFLDQIEGHSLIVPWVDQKRVLGHPAIKLFVTHCGWNSLTESVAISPVPKAFIPVAGEQALNAEVAERFWKIGKQLWVEGMPKTLQRNVIVERINECLNDPIIVESAKKLHNDHRQHQQTSAELCIKRLLAEIQC